MIFLSYRMRDAESMTAMAISRVADAMIKALNYCLQNLPFINAQPTTMNCPDLWLISCL
jgi:hypothetical protein